MKKKGYENKPRGKTLMNRLYNLQHAKTTRGLKVNGDPNSTNKARKWARNNRSQLNKKNAPRPATLSQNESVARSITTITNRSKKPKELRRHSSTGILITSSREEGERLRGASKQRDEQAIDDTPPMHHYDTSRTKHHNTNTRRSRG
ncbi:hypothetical protein YC2023_075953 [Brassica napus]